MSSSSAGGAAARSTEVVVCGRLGQPEQKVSSSVGVGLAVHKCVVERVEKLEPPLEVRVMDAYFGDGFETLCVRKDAKLRAQR